jgi:sugar phosphate isomerase/epimerase
MKHFEKVSRRQFLSSTAGAMAGGAAFPMFTTLGAEAPSPNQAKPWQIGCYTRPFDQFDYRVAMDGIAEAGFRYLGLMTAKIKQWVMLRRDTPPEEVHTMSAEAKQRSLSIISVYGDFSVTESVEEGVRGLKRLIDFAKICSCPNLMLGGTTQEKLYEPYYKTIKECCEYAAGNGVSLSIKPHGGQNATGPQCRRAIEKVGRKNFGLWYDPGNIYYYSEGKLDPVQDAETVDGLVMGMSVKDFKPPKEVLVNIGSGLVNFPAVFERLRKGGFTKGPLVVECLERGTLDQLKAAAKQARLFLEKLTGQPA